jgi:signal transduction histidine kinase
MSAPTSIRLYYRPLPRSAAAVCAVVVIFVGLLALVGWSMDLLLLQALVPGSRPMPYFTALGFVLSGAGLLAVFRGNRIVPLLCGFPVAIGFGYLLTEYSLWAGFGRIPLVSYLPLPAQVTEIGAQSSVVNLGLCMTGVALLRLPFINRNRPGLRELDMLTGFLFGVASAGIVAYRAAESAGNEWVWMFSMPVSVALCFMLIAVALNAISNDPDVRVFQRSELRMPVIITVLLVSLSLVTWLVLVLTGVNNFGSSLLVVGLLVSIPLASQTLEVWIRRLLLPEPVNTEGTFRALVESMGEGVLVCNRKGQVTLCNPAMRSFFGLPPLVQRGLGQLEHAWDPEYRLTQADGHSAIEWERSPLKQALAGGMPAPVEVLTGGVQPHFLRVIARPVLAEGNKVLGAVLTATDITEMKQGEDSLRRYSEVLARTTRELERVTYISAHHLQEPIREITSYAQLLARDCSGQLSGATAEYLDYLVGGAQRLKAQLDDLMTYLDIGSRRVGVQPVAMNDLLEKCRSEMGAIARDSVVQEGDLPSVMGDRVLLALLFRHLIDNALKFNRSPNPRVAVGARRVADHWEFCVTDNGIGIPPEHGERIFDLFQRLHVQERYPGTGIGLAICHKIVAMHGGRIWHEPSPGGGSRFCFRLPLVPPVMESRAAS